MLAVGYSGTGCSQFLLAEEVGTYQEKMQKQSELARPCYSVAVTIL